MFYMHIFNLFGVGYFIFTMLPLMPKNEQHPIIAQIKSTLDTRVNSMVLWQQMAHDQAMLLGCGFEPLYHQTGNGIYGPLDDRK